MILILSKTLNWFRVLVIKLIIKLILVKYNNIKVYLKAFLLKIIVNIQIKFKASKLILVRNLS